MFVYKYLLYLFIKVLICFDPGTSLYYYVILIKISVTVAATSIIVIILIESNCSSISWCLLSVGYLDSSSDDDKCEKFAHFTERVDLK